MESTRIRRQLFATRDLTLSAVLAAFYIVSTFIPVDAFIGGAAIISLEIVTVPVMAAILRPSQAAITIIVGSLRTTGPDYRDDSRQFRIPPQAGANTRVDVCSGWSCLLPYILKGRNSALARSLRP